MRDKDSYRDLLGERIENAYREKGDISKPTEIQMAKWKQIANMRRREKIRRRKIIASLASVFAMVFCVGMVSMFQIPDAEAGRDGIVDIIDSRDNDENIFADTYQNQEELPMDIKEEFLMFGDLPEDYEFEEIKIIHVGRKQRYEARISNDKMQIVDIYQHKIEGGDYPENVVASGDEKVIWGEKEICISNHTDEKTIVYSFLYKSTFVTIRSNDDIEQNIIKEMVNEVV